MKIRNWSRVTNKSHYKMLRKFWSTIFITQQDFLPFGHTYSDINLHYVNLSFVKGLTYNTGKKIREEGICKNVYKSQKIIDKLFLQLLAVRKYVVAKNITLAKRKDCSIQGYLSMSDRAKDNLLLVPKPYTFWLYTWLNMYIFTII